MARFQERIARFEHARRARCTVCDAEISNTCSRCQSASYCSSKCQKEDWPLHKMLCKKYKDFLSTKRYQGHRVAILLPENQSKPRLVWIESSLQSESRDTTNATTLTTMKETPKLRPLLGLTDDDPEPFFLTTDHDLGSKFQLPYCLQATSRDLKTQTTTNECVAALVGVLPGSFWKGPVVLTRFYTMNSTQSNGSDNLRPPPLIHIEGRSSVVVGESEQVEDMTLAAFTHAMGLLEAANVAELEADNGQ